MPSIANLPDAMSDVLDLARMHGDMVCNTLFRAPWSLQFSRPCGHFHIVERGEALLVCDNGERFAMRAGDVAIIPLGLGHVLCSDPALAPQAIEAAIFAPDPAGGPIMRLGGDGAETAMVCGQFSFRGVLAPRLIGQLPRLLRIEAEADQPADWLALTARFLVAEARNPTPGSAIMIARLLELMFIQAMRAWGSQASGGLGWLGGLGHPGIGRSLAAMHDAPARDWTVTDLAQIAGMSRSAFASRFDAVVGTTPQRYLAAWRLDLAAEALRTRRDRVATIAGEVGYASQTAFNRAFKAHFGMTPAAFRAADPAGAESRP